MTQVYFARLVGNDTAVKIGLSACPTARVVDLGWRLRHRCELLATIPGDQRIERRFHLLFLDHWLGGEWFAMTRDLAATIEAVATGKFDVSRLPAFRSLPRRLLWQSVALDRLGIAA